MRRDTLPPPAGSRVYELTEWGSELEPVVLGLGRWGSRAPFPPGDKALGTEAFVLALKTLFDPAAADGATGTYELRLGDQRFSMRVADAELQVSRGGAEMPVATVETESGALQQVLFAGRRLDDVIRSGELSILGDRAAGERLLSLFTPPRRA